MCVCILQPTWKRMLRTYNANCLPSGSSWKLLLTMVGVEAGCVGVQQLEMSSVSAQLLSNAGKRRVLQTMMRFISSTEAQVLCCRVLGVMATKGKGRRRSGGMKVDEREDEGWGCEGGREGRMGEE